MGSSVSEAKPVPADVPEATLLFEPRPSKLLVGHSALVIAECLFLVAVSIGAMASTFDPCSFISGVILLPVPLFIAVQQYRGVFHRQTGAAFAAACCLVVFGALFVFGAVVNVLEFVFDNRRTGVDWGKDWPGFCILAVIGLVGLTNIVLAWQSWRWSKLLALAGLGAAKRSFSLRELLAVITVIGLVAGCARWATDSRPAIGIDVPPETAPRPVPSTAKNVCYSNGGRGTQFIEFTTDEATFRKWVAAEVEPLGHRKLGHQVHPLSAFSSPTGVIGVDGERHELQRGLSYGWSFEDEGVSATFDADTGRAYFHVHWY